jgi:hypothetical protein
MTSSIRVSKPAEDYYRVTIMNPPIDPLDPPMITAFGVLIDRLEASNMFLSSASVVCEVERVAQVAICCLVWICVSRAGN